MKLTSIEIYGFGQFENKKFELGDGNNIKLFYGENEAGKSTIMAFIHAIFFGFPTRNSSENRYEPKNGGKYGGKIMIAVNDRKFTIERISGRAAGEVTVSDENGLTGAEEQLNELLNGLDRSLYMGIFSFGFKGLQRVEQVKAADLSRYLFSAGASGSQSLFDFEKKLNKQLDEMYRPNGRKPLLNEKIAQLDVLRKQLASWEEKTDAYNRIVAELQSLRENGDMLKNQEAAVQLSLKQYEKKLIMKPHVEERKKWQLELQQIENHSPFPVEGLKRQQELQFQLRPLMGQLESISQKMTELEDELANFQIEQVYLEHEDTIQALQEKQPLIEMQEKQITQQLAAVEFEVSEMNALLEKLGSAFREEDIEKVETSLFVKQQLKELMTNEERLKEQQKLLDGQLKKAKQELELSQLTMQHLRGATGSGSKSSVISLAVLLSFILIAGVVSWQWLNSIYPLLIAIVLGIAVFVKMLFAKPRNNQEFEKEKVILQQHEKVYEDVVKQLETLAVKQQHAQKSLAEFCGLHHLPEGLTGEQLVIAFDLIEEIKKRICNKKRIFIEIQQLKQSVASFYEQLAKLMVRLQENSEPSLRNLQEIIKKVAAEKEKQQRLNKLFEKKEELSDERLRLQKQVEVFEQSIMELYASAEVTDEEAFLQKGLAAVKYEEIAGKIAASESYLRSILKAGEDSYITEIENEWLDYESLIKETEQELLNVHEKMKDNQLKIANLVAEQKALEDGSSYSELMHRYELEKSAFQQDVKRWAIMQVASAIVAKTKNYYREVRLPHVINTAQQFFSFLTYGRYPQIFAPTEESGFIVERNDGIRFEPNELSQATTEQLYLSIRLALAINYKSSSPLPLLIDDSFVNFDSNRTRRALELIDNIATLHNHQLLLFTCHEHVANHFPQDKIIQL